MDTRPVKIYSDENVPRLRYIAGIILGDILGLQWEVITDKRKLGKHPVINYSHETISGSFKICPHSLLFEKGVIGRDISVEKWNGLPVFFKTQADSDFPFDIFAASFFLVSRYEEYLGHQPDAHNRYKASSSIAWKNGFLEIPVVDLWAKEMAKYFLKRCQTVTFRRNDYKALLTFDIDQPYAYLGKNLLRSIGGLLRDIKSNSGNAGDRYRIVVKGKKDPFEVFDYLEEKIAFSNSDVRFFFPVGDHSEYDKNPSWKNSDYRNLIRTISGKYKTGIHPSYYSTTKDSVLEDEVSRLRTILENEVVHSRFHYIRFSMPLSYCALHKAGITEDYSMGYPEETGFRAGIARPFYFYDILEDTQTSLRIIPFQVMDVTLYNYKKLNPEQSRELIFRLISETRKVGGLFVSIWHNTSLLENVEWKAWKEVFEFMIKNQAP